MYDLPRAVWIALLLWALSPLAVTAQGETIRVRIIGPAGAGVSGVAVTLRDAAGQLTLAEGVTTAEGAVRFDHLSASAVRLSLRGTTATGEPIVLGEVSFIDDESLLVYTAIGGPDVLLVMDEGGAVYVDPQQISPEVAERAPALAATAAAAPTPPADSSTPIAAGPAPAQPASFPLWLLITVGGLLTAGVLALGARRAR